MLWTTNGICNVQKKDIHRNLQKCIIFNIPPTVSHSFQGIQHYMVNLWKYCVYSIVRYWYHAKFAIGSRKQFGCKIKVAGRCDSRYSILPFGAITKICFIFINHIYLTLRSRFHFILIHMILQLKQIFDRIPNEKVLHLESHRLAILFWRSDCYLATVPKFCAILVINYWAHITFAQIYNVMTYTVEAVGNFMRSIEKWQIPIDYLV